MRFLQGHLRGHPMVTIGAAASFVVGAVDEQKIRDMADALVDRGFVQAGYTYLNIDGERHRSLLAQKHIPARRQHFAGSVPPSHAG